MPYCRGGPHRRASPDLSAFCDERFRRAGELALAGGRTVIEADLVLDQLWRQHMDSRHFATEATPAAGRQRKNG